MKTHLAALTGIRAYAALWVIFFHLANHLTFGIFNPIISKGYLGVDLFFILSGFVISCAHQKDFSVLKGKQIFEFLMLRLARLMPVHVFVLMLFAMFYIGLVLLRGYKPVDSAFYPLDGFILTLFNLQAWFTYKSHSWNALSWSVSAEWFAYILFPFLTLYLAKVEGVKRNIGYLAGVFTGLYLFSLIIGVEHINWWHSAPLVRHPLERVSFEFTSGILLYNLFKQKAASEQNWDAIGLMAMMAIIGGFYLGTSDFITVPILGLMIYALANAKTALRVIFSNKIIVHLGEISYSLYLIDGFTYLMFSNLQKFTHLSIFSPESGILFSIAAICCSLLSSQLLYTFIEEPSRKYLRSLIKDRQAKGQKEMIPIQA